MCFMPVSLSWLTGLPGPLYTRLCWANVLDRTDEGTVSSPFPVRECGQGSEHQSHGQPQLVVCPTPFQSTTLICYPSPLSLGTLDSKGLWSLFPEGKPLNQEADPKGRHVLTSLKKGQGPTSLSRAEQ